MACVYRQGKVLRAPLTSQPELLLIVFLLNLFSAAAGSAQAAPLIFKFEATIFDVQGDTAALNLPFALTVGQKVSAEYFFESPEDLLDIFDRQHLGKLGQIVLSIGGTELNATTNIGLINSAGWTDPLLVGPKSSIVFGYQSPTDVDPGWAGYFQGLPWDPILALFGPEGTMTETTDALDADVWNQLTTLRRLDLQFGYYEQNQFKIVTVKSTVGKISISPEPSSRLSFLLGVSLTLGFALHREIAQNRISVSLTSESCGLCLAIKCT